jgi:hypothetical protein
MKSIPREIRRHADAKASEERVLMSWRFPSARIPGQLELAAEFVVRLWTGSASAGLTGGNRRHLW